ncbi:MAG: DUF2807 domain-containing protein [Gammaproteobacteria bacterium]
MKKILYILLYVCLLSLLCGFSWHSKTYRINHSLQPVYQPYIIQDLVLSPFNNVIVKANVDVTIIAGEPSQTITVSGPNQGKPCLDLSVSNNTLIIVSKEPHVPCARLQMVITVPELKAVTQLGPGTVTLKNMNGQHFNATINGSGSLTASGKNINIGMLTVNGPGTVKINGYVILNKLLYNGSGQLQIYWVDSHDLSIVSFDHGLIQLAGRADLMHAVLYDHAHLDARFLRTKTAFVHTMARSQADVAVTKMLYTFALNNSNIYYFVAPIFLTTDNRSSGNVLNMAAIHKAILEFDPHMFD